MQVRLLPALVSLLVVSASAANAGAQGPLRSATAEAPVRAAFQITPLLQRLETAPGRIIPFSFTAQSLGAETKIHIRPIALKQQENGLVLPDEDGRAPQAVQIEGGEERLLPPGESITIRGRITAPLAGGVFHSYGILVTELGQAQGAATTPSETPGGTNISLRFITRYLLRLETHVLGLSGEDVSQVHLVAGDLTERDGLPLARVMLQNAMDTAAELEVRCRLTDRSGKPAAPQFSLMMPVRAGEQGARRFEALVLGRSRIAMEAPLPEPVFPGSYLLEAEIVHRGRSRRREAFPVQVAEGDFPAQEAQVARLDASLQLAPTQIELSLRPMGNRLLPLELKNTSSRPIHVRLAPQPWNDMYPDWLVIRPETFSIGPHQSRKVLVALRGGGEVQDHRCGMLRVEATPEGAAQAATRDLPVAVLGTHRALPQYELGELRYLPQERGGLVTLEVFNAGAEPLAPEARLLVTDALGRAVRTLGGFGRWVLPGQTRDLEFSIPHLPPGKYRLQMEIAWTPELQPLIFERDLEVLTETTPQHAMP
jgi:hypothetical protein